MNFRLAVDSAAAFDEGERRNIRNPKESTMAKAILTGLVFRNDLASAMMRRE